MARRINLYLVASGKYHDIDFARLELLKLFAEHEGLRVRVAEDYRDSAAIEASDALVTYTCDVTPSEAEVEGLGRYLAQGKRWLALHGTNSILRFLENGKVSSPNLAPDFMKMLGSQFIAHPPIQRFNVTVSDKSHPLVAGIDDFVVEDELYLSDYHGHNHALLETRFTGKADGFEREVWPDDTPHLVYYLHEHGGGEIAYMTLGHCRGKYDLQPLVDVYPFIERGAWNLPVFYDLLRRGVRWAARLDG
jgi:type 1 glutamine amidotransferase